MLSFTESGTENEISYLWEVQVLEVCIVVAECTWVVLPQL